MIQALIRHHLTVSTLTIIIWLMIGWFLGAQAFFMVVILTLLEVTLSADNAVVNSRVLVTMSPLWQKLFMTVGIFIAVFVMRFAIPILIVAFTTSLDSWGALRLAVSDPEEYGHKLHDAAPMIDGFGGMFLLMVAAYFFIDKEKKTHWLRVIEKPLSRLDMIKGAKVICALAILALVYFTVEKHLQNTVIASMLVALVVYWTLHGVTILMERFSNEGSQKIKHKVGWAAFASFVYLEVLDASFSLDGVVGAFALTNNIIIIMAGLGIGALWVRTLTLQMVKDKTLARYQFLESGAHVAIFFLSLIMFGKLFHIELPEILIGSIGLICIALSIISSKRVSARTA